jgi:hypothetical protein
MRKGGFFFFAFILGVLLAAPGRGHARQAVTTNLAAYWPMDTFASNSTPDASGNGHAATQATAANQPATTPGMFSGALLFNDTSDYLSAPDSAGLNVGTAGFTVAAWVKPSGSTADRVLNKWNGTIGWLFDINTGTGGTASAGTVRLKMSDGTNTVDQSANAGLAVGAWTHVAAVVDRSAQQLKFYANGVQVGTTVGISGLTGTLTSTAALGIGSIPSSLGNYYGGALDEVRLYTAALTPAQILTLIQPQLPTSLTAVPDADPFAQAIDLSWTASAGSLSYRVYRAAASGGPYTQIASGLTGTTYTDSGLQPETKYYYVVRGFNTVEGGNSNEAFAVVPAIPPHVSSKAPDHPICGIAVGGETGSAAGFIGLAALLLALALTAVRKAS